MLLPFPCVSLSLCVYVPHAFCSLPHPLYLFFVSRLYIIPHSLPCSLTHTILSSLSLFSLHLFSLSSHAYLPLPLSLADYINTCSIASASLKSNSVLPTLIVALRLFEGNSLTDNRQLLCTWHMHCSVILSTPVHVQLARTLLESVIMFSYVLLLKGILLLKDISSFSIHSSPCALG